MEDFLEQNVERLKNGDIRGVEMDIERVNAESDGYVIDYVGHLKKELLRELIWRHELDALKLLVENMDVVPLLNAFVVHEMDDIKVSVRENDFSSGFETTETPFLTEDMEILGILPLYPGLGFHLNLCNPNQL